MITNRIHPYPFAKCIALVLLGIQISGSVSAQEKKKGYSRIYVTFNPQYHLSEKFNVKNDNLYPNPIHVKNTIESYGSIEYERTTRYGLILNGGLLMGKENQDISIIYDLSNFNPLATNSLNGQMISYRTTPSIKYFGPRLMIGYRKKITNKWSVSVRAGFTMRYLTSGVDDRGLLGIVYLPDNGEIIDEQVIVYDMVYGKRGSSKFNQQGRLSQAIADRITGGSLIYNMNISTSYDLNKKWIKNITLGIEAHPNIWPNGYGFLTTKTKTKSYVHSTGGQISIDNHSDRKISIGLRMGVGLWR